MFIQIRKDRTGEREYGGRKSAQFTHSQSLPRICSTNSTSKTARTNEYNWFKSTANACYIDSMLLKYMGIMRPKEDVFRMYLRAARLEPM